MGFSDALFKSEMFEKLHHSWKADVRFGISPENPIQ